MTRGRVLATLSASAALLLLAPPVVAQTGPGTPALTVNPAMLGSLQAPGTRVTQQLTLGNTGDGTVQWQVTEDSDDPWRLPVRPTTPVDSAPVPEPGGSAEFQPYPGFRGRPGWMVEPDLPMVPDGALTLTHSQAATIVAGSSVACAQNRGIRTMANSYFRHFTLDDYAIAGDLRVTAVSFGLEAALGEAVGLTVNLYTMLDPAAPLRSDNLHLIGTAGTMLSDQLMTIVQVPVAATVPAGSTLVVEVVTPELSQGGIYLGANPAGQTASSYLRAEECGIPEPAPTAELGFPDMQLLLYVTGLAEVPDCRVPSGAGWAGVDPLAGEVPPGGQQSVAVSFDSTGLADGELRTADLCLSSNDPRRAFLAVPLALRVDQRCGRTLVGPHPDPLTVTDGVTCLAPGVRVGGAVNVLDGAGLVAGSVTVQGPLSTFGATVAELTGSQLIGPVSLRGTTGSLVFSGNQVVGSVLVVANATGTAPVVGGNFIVGSLFCTDNQPPPVDGGTPNTVVGGLKLAQCGDL